MNAGIVLGIETSCDETGVGIVRAGAGGVELLANELASSVEEHARFGGVVPEVASRAHLQAMVPAVHRALATAGLRGRDVDAVAVTAGPGLTGALLVGVAAAKAYAAAWDVPLYGVNHLAAHVAVDTVAHGPLPPCLALLVSGGHSSLLDVPDVVGPITPLGAARCVRRAQRVEHDVPARGAVGRPRAAAGHDAVTRLRAPGSCASGRRRYSGSSGPGAMPARSAGAATVTRPTGDGASGPRTGSPSSAPAPPATATAPSSGSRSASRAGASTCGPLSRRPSGS
jgi:hypothetical protein